MTLPTLIAELEEALKAATPEPWELPPDDYYKRPGPIVLHFTDVDADEDGRPMDCGEDICEMADTPRDEANARLIALMRNSLPTLIEALKRQGEALEKIAKGKYGKCPIEGHWPPEKPCTLCGDLGFFDDQPEYDPAKDGHCVEGGARAIALRQLSPTHFRELKGPGQ